MLKVCKINTCPNGTLGLHLSRAPWDPYPWVSGIQEGSSAEKAGMRVGDTVLEFNGNDILGQKIVEIATKIREHCQNGATDVSAVVWRNIDGESSCSDESVEYDDDECEKEHEKNVIDSNDSGRATIAAKSRRKRVHRSYQHHQHSSINQQSLQKFATCLQHIAQLLECPVCLEVIRPPGWQCCNGHMLCNNCRHRSVKCPVCRVPLGPRGRCLLADKLFNVLAESFPCDGVQINRDLSQERRKCSTKSKGCPPKSNTTIPNKRSGKEQQPKAKEIQQKDIKNIKTTVGIQKNVSNGKVAAKLCTTTPINDIQQVSNTIANSKSDDQENSQKNILKFVENEDENSSHRESRWQWRRSRIIFDKEQQQQQSNKRLQIYKRCADEQLSNTVSRVMTTMRTTNGSS